VDIPCRITMAPTLDGFQLILQTNYTVINLFIQEDYDEEELTFDLIAVDVNSIN
jgi:riboflavin synthase